MSGMWGLPWGRDKIQWKATAAQFSQDSAIGPGPSGRKDQASSPCKEPGPAKISGRAEGTQNEQWVNCNAIWLRTKRS